jgi:hypothetical protein
MKLGEVDVSVNAEQPRVGDGENRFVIRLLLLKSDAMRRKTCCEEGDRPILIVERKSVDQGNKNVCRTIPRSGIFIHTEPYQGQTRSNTKQEPGFNH